MFVPLVRILLVSESVLLLSKHQGTRSDQFKLVSLEDDVTVEKVGTGRTDRRLPAMN